jgi:hypothetical protein
MSEPGEHRICSFVSIKHGLQSVQNLYLCWAIALLESLLHPRTSIDDRLWFDVFSCSTLWCKLREWGIGMILRQIPAGKRSSGKLPLMLFACRVHKSLSACSLLSKPETQCHFQQEKALPSCCTPEALGHEVMLPWTNMESTIGAGPVGD